MRIGKTGIWLFVFGMLIGPVELYAQGMLTSKSRKAIEAYNNGIRSYSLNNFANAEKQFLVAIQEDEQFIEAYLVLAEVYEDKGQPREAIGTYLKAFAIDESFFPYGWIRLGNLAYKEAMYHEAKTSYQKYLEISPGNLSNENTARKGIERCEFAENAMRNPVDFKPENLGAAINTHYDEYWPSLSTDEKTLVITRLVNNSSIPGRMQEDFYISHYQDSAWTVMSNAGEPLNTPDNEGAQTISGDGRLMVFTACNRSDGLGRCDLYFSTREGENWSTPKNMGSPVNTSFRETQPSLSADGRTLYFSSNRNGGKGQHDIWVSHLDMNNHWSPPENLGDSINTGGIEMSPFIHPDGKTLYFSSDGFTGMGGYDLFMSRQDENGNWGSSMNLGFPINTNRDEIGLIVNARGDKAYYSSDMDPRQGKDIFMFDMPQSARPEAVTYMKGKIFNAITDLPLKAQFELTDLNTGSVIYFAYSDSISGEFLVSIPTDHNYMLNVSSKGYLFFSENFAMNGTYDADEPFLKDIPLQPLHIGVSIVLKNIFYETDSFALKRESIAELRKVVDFLKQNPDVRIEISGHTDNTGNPAYNQQLSENRAKTIADYLINANIESDRVRYQGYGMNMPVTGNDTEVNRALNRRTELKIIE